MDDDSEKAPFIPLSNPSSSVSSRLSDAGSWLYTVPRRRRNLFALAFVALTGLFLYFHSQTPGPKLVCLDSSQLEELENIALPPALPVHVTKTSTSTVTVTAPAVTETVTVQKSSRTLEPVVFSLIMFSESSAIEGALLIKSAIMYTTRPLEFHIICDEAAQSYLERKISVLQTPAHNILMRFYRVPHQSMVDRIRREGGIWSDHAAGVPGLMKLFIHEILPDSVRKAIYVDTDAFFITDPALLWQTFDNLRPSTAISMPTHFDQDSPQWHQASKICSCVMLLDLSKLRALRLMDSSIYRADKTSRYPSALSPPLFRSLFGPPGPEDHYEGVALGDQAYYWAIVSQRPDIFEHLSLDWEVSSCLLDMYGTGLDKDHDGNSEHDERGQMVHLIGTPQEGGVILPKLLHFNCLEGVEVYWEWPGWTDPAAVNELTTLAQRWKPTLDHHLGTKWIWLNRGSAKVYIDTVHDPLFGDQRYAVEHDMPLDP